MKCKNCGCTPLDDVSEALIMDIAHQCWDGYEIFNLVRFVSLFKKRFGKPSEARVSKENVIKKIWKKEEEFGHILGYESVVDIVLESIYPEGGKEVATAYDNQPKGIKND